MPQMYLPKGKASSAVEAAKAAVISVWGIKPKLLFGVKKNRKTNKLFFHAFLRPVRCFFQKKNFADAFYL